VRIILHIDLNSYFATIEQQANPRLRGKPIGVTGGDRLDRTVLGTASIEAKKLGVKTGMPIWEAKRLCPNLILVRGDSDKYLSTTKQFINILKDYSPDLEIFSIDESFLELPTHNNLQDATRFAVEIKQKIRSRIGEWVTCSIGISYNKLMAKLASDLQKPDGLVAIYDEESACWILDRCKLDDLCGIGYGIKKRLFDLGVADFKRLRLMSKESLLAHFKSYGETLYNMARGIDHTPVLPFYEKDEVKSIGHQYTLNNNTGNLEKIRQLLLKLTELIARRSRAKKLVGKTVSCWFRYADFSGAGMQITIPYTHNGLEVFNGAWTIFNKTWTGRQIRLVAVSLSNLKPQNPHNLTFLEEDLRQERIIKTLDLVNDKYGEFTLKRGYLL